ncbi:heparan-alpha-glucosaminide N-acetyltransferase [Methanimicrococcus hongohii]|uniref:heparan-alpha-glucosaminide N-acetyltransferase n=1 Tax=Methanimicrococcus hongohii TaxID=3028295 RepID=UPI00292FBF7C|nr:heparan-alpha-glucosaminide N-acetyltransferase [Methanimicrococcus sp. Hf6]
MLHKLQTKSNSHRYFELDAFRGITVILMVICHFLFDLDYFGLWDMPYRFWPQQRYGFPITIMFIGIAGVSLSLAASKTKDAGTLTKKFIKRGAFLFAAGLLITAVTWIYPHDGAILFGVLHLIGISTILAVPFLLSFTKEAQDLGKYKEKAAWLIPLFFGIIVILLGEVVEKINGPIWLIPLGIHPYGFYSLDYEPLFPWFGVVLLGVAVGAWLYPRGVRRFSFEFLKNEPPFLKRVS